MDLKNIPLISLQSHQMKDDPTTIALCRAFDEQMKQLIEDVNNLLILSNITSLDDVLLNELAWQFHVDEYNTEFPLDVKRELVKNSLQTHKYLGTKYACEKVMKAIFGTSSKIEEWFEYNGLPYHFRVRTTNQAATNEMAEEFLRTLDVVKNVRSRLDEIIIEMSADMDLNYGCMIEISEYIYISAIVLEMSANMNLNYGCMLEISEYIYI